MGAVCLVVLFVLGGVGYFGLRQMNRTARAASCPNDVYHLFQALRQYAADHDGLVPPISVVRGNIMMDPDGFYLKYLTNSCWTQCEYSPARQKRDGHHKNDDLGNSAFNDDSFCYLPWETTTEKEALAFIQAYKNLDLRKREDDLHVMIDDKLHTLPRTRLSSEVLRQGFEDGAPEIPLIVEWPNHAHIRGTIYYTNGFREMKDIGDGFPMTADILAGLREIASMDRPIPEWEFW